LEIGEHGEHATVVVGAVKEAELAEDVGNVRLYRLDTDVKSCGHRLVGTALGHQCQHLELARCQ